MSRRVEVAGVTTWTRVLADGANALPESFRTMWDFGNIDAFIAVYRSKPSVLQSLAQVETQHDELRVILEGARDFRLAEAVGLRLMSKVSARPLLTKREHEVVELVCQGLTNREIGRTLYIEETTVKAHVRSICKKLGVRSRTEAAIRASELAG
jgi:DNA-binding NarL/FixJ family response regulator